MKGAAGSWRRRFRGVLLGALLVLQWGLSAQTAQTKPDALLEYRNGRFERAVEICKNEIAANPGNIESHVVICWSLVGLERYAEALPYARSGRELNYLDVRIAEILGEILFFLGRNDEAQKYFEEYVELAPEGSRIDRVYYFLGEIFIRQGRYRLADIALSTAIRWVPGNAAWWVRLAFVNEHLGNLPEAAAAYERALALDFQIPDARQGLERVRLAMNRR